MPLARRMLPLLLSCALVAGTGAACSDKARYPGLIARGEVVSVDLAAIGPGDGRFHTYRSRSGKNVDLFVYRDSSGAPHAVLDACRTCYRWKKGYALVGKDVLCRKCGMRFEIDGLATGSGSCVPIAVKSEQRGGALLIQAAELEAGARYF
jgi:uncharacterized membrane protein